MSDLLDAIAQLPEKWHAAGSLSMPALAAIDRHASAHRPIRHSVETGCGKSTLLLSHLSENHVVFTAGGAADDSMARVLESPLLREKHIQWVVGPSQLTLPRYDFGEPVQLALIDGPHAYPFPEIEYWCLYPRLVEGGLLVLDDVHIPTVYHLFNFLRDEPMFALVDTVENTAIFRRTSAPPFSPIQDNWWKQAYNIHRFPIVDFTCELRPGFRGRIAAALPESLKRAVRLFRR